MVSSIAIVVAGLPPVPPSKVGAVEHWVDEASRRMAPPNSRLAVVSRPAGVAGHEAIEHIGIPWTATELFFHRIKECVTWKTPLRYLAKIHNVFSYGRRVAKAACDFDVVYLHSEPGPQLLPRKRTGPRIVMHMRLVIRFRCFISSLQ